MQEKEEKESQIIEEIDREISDLVEEEGPVLPKAPEEAGSPKTVGTEKSGEVDREGAPEAKPEPARNESREQQPQKQDRRARQLREDGIVIKK